VGWENELDTALARLSADGLVAFPTETVWGLAARASSEAAVAKLRAWKGRCEAQPISLLVDASEGLEEYGFSMSPLARALMGRFWPGPATFVLPCESRREHAGTSSALRFAAGIAREDGAVGLRCSTHPAAAALARGARERGLGPITATSFNRSGKLPARTRDEAGSLCADTGEDTPDPLAGVGEDTPDLLAGLNEVFRFAPEGCDATGAAPSSVVDLTGGEPRILRPGPLDREILAAAREVPE
jgi:L-threonylcarbamoyladenylate synthase